MTADAPETTESTAPSPMTDDFLSSVAALLEKASNEELGQAEVLVEKEIARRIAEAEQAAEDLRTVLGRPKTGSDTTEPPTSTKAKATSKGTRTPRGEAKEVILAFLQDGTKTRKQIEEHFISKGMSTASVGTLLSRMKKKEEIRQVGDTNQYNRP